MTPQEARELLDKATPGPWDCVGQDDEYPRVARDGYQDITNDATNFNAPLIAAAPALAELVASMHYEYAVQGPDGRWVRETDDRKLELTIDPMRALRRYNPFIIERLAEAASAQFNGECRIVRRLATDPEVVE